ncbi:hypothetical protein Btru_064565 [Bulinus truncatus]|nr:hypothetical protein Btru_064565 [Bulinus truncatus]
MFHSNLILFTVCILGGMQAYGLSNFTKDHSELVSGESFSITCNADTLFPNTNFYQESWVLILQRILDVSMVEEVMVEMNLTQRGEVKTKIVYGWSYVFSYKNHLLTAKKSYADCVDSGSYECVLFTLHNREASPKISISYHIVVSAKPVITSLIMLSGYQRKAKSYHYYNKLLCTAEAALGSELIWLTMCKLNGIKDALQAEIKTVKLESQAPRGVTTECERSYFTSTFNDIYPDITKVCNITCCVHNRLRNFTNIAQHNSECKSKETLKMKLSSEIKTMTGRVNWMGTFLIAVIGITSVVGVVTVFFFTFKCVCIVCTPASFPFGLPHRHVTNILD